MTSSATVSPEFGRRDFSGFIARENTEQNESRLRFTAMPQLRLQAPRTGYTGAVIAIGYSPAEAVKRIVHEASESLSVKLRSRIRELLNLNENWDGEGAKPVKPHVVADVIEALRQLKLEANVFHEPFLVATFDGFVQMEWHEGTRSLDIEATEKGWSAVGTTAVLEGNRQYHSAEFGRNDFARLAEWYRWVLGSELLLCPSL